MLQKITVMLVGAVLLCLWFVMVPPLQAQNPTAAIKGPGQAPAVSDPALVVAISPNSVTLANITPHDCSGTITTGGTAQTAVPATASLHGFTIVNLSNGDTVWIAFNGAAAAAAVGSYPLLPFTTTGGGSFTSPASFATNAGVSIVGPTTADPFSCTWW